MKHEVPLTLEGASVLHQMFRIRWQAWKALEAGRRLKILDEAAGALGGIGGEAMNLFFRPGRTLRRALGLAILAVVAVLGYAVLGEDVSPMRWLGVIVICVGVFVVGRTSPRTTGQPRRE